jgi:Xaa-Pro dipeptidase
VQRREFVRNSAMIFGTATAESVACESQIESDVLSSMAALRPMTDDVVPISDAERLQRMEKARRLMAENRISALFIEPGATLSYFTGVRWGNSERMFAFILPAKGEPAFVCPAFEDQRAFEVIKFTKDVRLWQEDENPGAHVAQVLRDRAVATGRLGVDGRVRYFLTELIRKAAPSTEITIADAVTVGCRSIKSSAELALMQKANDITIAAFKAAFAEMKEGMTQAEFGRNVAAAFKALGVDSGGTPQFGKYTAFPHGSREPQRLKEGDVVLLDSGCSIEGYQSDITRTTVFGKPTDRQRQVWELEQRAQLAALNTAKVGVACEDLDAAARKVIVDAGFGPGYKVPGLPHRTGHGIGMEGHEAPNLVRGEKTKLAPGMCFSDEPTIVIYGEFGIRLEDCWYMTEDGPKTFTKLSPAIDRPFG